MTYATLTNAQKEAITRHYEQIKHMSSLSHVSAIIADSMTTGQNARNKSNAFAAVYTFIGWQLKAAI
jgi:uncharacterized membrane protein